MTFGIFTSSRVEIGFQNNILCLTSIFVLRPQLSSVTSASVHSTVHITGNNRQFLLATWSWIWLQSRNYTCPRCKTPHQRQLKFHLATISCNDVPICQCKYNISSAGHWSTLWPYKWTTTSSGGSRIFPGGANFQGGGCQDMILLNFHKKRHEI